MQLGPKVRRLSTSFDSKECENLSICVPTSTNSFYAFGAAAGSLVCNKTRMPLYCFDSWAPHGRFGVPVLRPLDFFKGSSSVCQDQQELRKKGVQAGAQDKNKSISDFCLCLDRMPAAVEIKCSRYVCCNLSGFGGCRNYMKEEFKITCSTNDNHRLGITLGLFASGWIFEGVDKKLGMNPQQTNFGGNV